MSENDPVTAPVPLKTLLADDVAFDDWRFEERWGAAFLVVDEALHASPFDLDGTLPENQVWEGAAPARKTTQTVVYLLRRRIAEPGRPVTIGRTEATDVVVNDRTISKLHAFVDVQRDGSARVTDAGSKNGTAVSGVKLSAPPDGAPGTARPGDVVTFGTVNGQYLDLRGMRKFLGTHPDRRSSSSQQQKAGARVERVVSPESGRNMMSAVVDALAAVKSFRERGVELDIAGGAKTLTDLDRPDLSSSSSGPSAATPKTEEDAP